MDDAKKYITEQTSLWGGDVAIGFGNNNFCVKTIDRNVANSIIKKEHYSKKFYSASYIHLGVFAEKKLLGVLQFGYAMNPASQQSVVANTQQDEYLELNRMWLSDELPRNSESKAISYAIKFIKRRYPKIKWIQSFADERCGKLGVVYQASNFKYYGEHIATFWEYEGEYFHNSLMTRRPELSKSAAYIQEHKGDAVANDLRQLRYLYFIKKSSEKDCLLQQKQYEKHYTNC